WLN
ncbi:hypothetical protein ZOSMA_341G00030, partial [Zostera marina]